MALEVVDSGKRQLARGRDPLRHAPADEQRPDETGAAGRCDQRDVIEARARARERLVDHRVDQLGVVARGDLGNDAAEARVHLLGGDHVGGDRSVAPDERGARVVAARLEREDHGRWWATGSAAGTSSRRPWSVAGVRHMISASSPLSW